MVAQTVARAAVFADLRHKIAGIEGRLAETLDGPSDQVVLRRNGVPARPFRSTGSPCLDEVLGEANGLMEIHGAATRDSGAVAGFALALASSLTRQSSRPLLWVGTSEIFREAGRPYAPGLAGWFGLSPERLLVAEAEKPVDALWIAEQAAGLDALAAILLELRGSPRLLDLTATRRLQSRAAPDGRPLFLVRQAGTPEPTAASLRLVVSAAPAGLRHTLGGPLQGSIGPPAFTVAIGKSRAPALAPFTLEWNREAKAFEERDHASGRAKDSGPVAALPADRESAARSLRPRLAAAPAKSVATAGDQPSREQHAADRVA